MARQYKDVTITGGRDDGKTFRITEMSAEAGEWFAYRLIGVLLEADKEGELSHLTDLLGKAGNMELVAAAGGNAIVKILLKANPDKVKPLLDEMRNCWQLKCDNDFLRALIDTDIEEIGTLMILRMKTLELHISFFTSGVQSLMA